MPDLLRLSTSDWELTVWCNDISRRQRALRNTLERRGKADDMSKQTIRFNQALVIEEFEVLDQKIDVSGEHKELELPEALFFENCQYQFEWIFNLPNVSKAEVAHRLKAVNDSFRFNDRRKPRVLTGTINTRNDLGWFALPIEYKTDSTITKQAVSFEVLPVKMDLHSDLTRMYETIDKNYPLWRFKLANKTQQTVGKDKNRGYFPILWLAYFEQLREKMEAGLKVIANSPHSRLQPFTHKVKADRLRGRLSQELVERVKQHQAQGRNHERYQQTKKQLSVDTPENRFIKMVVKTTKERLEGLYSRLAKNNQTPDKQVFSEAFLDELKSWQLPLAKFQRQSVMNEVGDFTGLTKESLVLQQKTGYSTVYRVWQELKYYLDAFAGQSSISIKSVAEIYEIWCFLELRNILINQLGFTEKARSKGRLKLQEFEYRLEDGMAGAFEFERDDDVKVELAHEPLFRKDTVPIRTWQVTQKPDILLKVTFPDGRNFIWLFDAKYRIQASYDTEEGEIEYDEKAETEQLVPEDAINQMHRYRDALIHISNNTKHKSRPVCGAFALYPGFIASQKSANPYTESIKEIGIGAFPLLPSADGTGASFLTQFLIEQIGRKTSYDISGQSDKLYVQDAMRIPNYGMKQVLYPDLVLTVALGSGRNKEYKKRYEEGTARWYHIPKTVFDEQLGEHVAGELAYLAVGTISSGETGRSIKKVWKVSNYTIKKRKDIKKEQAGGGYKKKDENNDYYLFELGECLTLSEAITGMPVRHFRPSMKLTRLDFVHKTKVFKELPAVYVDMLKN